MTVEQGLVAELTGDATVSGIVGTKVYAGAIPQGQDSPALVFNRISSPREINLDGTSSVVPVRFRIDSWHTSMSGVWTLANAVRAALNNIGVSGSGTLGSEPVQVVYIEDEIELHEFDGDRRDFRVAQDWVVVITE